jgi:YVTN family beta-propeller protein
VSSFGTDRVGKLDANGNVLARIQIGPVSGALPDSRHARGPRGLAMHPAGTHVYVQNRFSNTISIVDIASTAQIAEIAVGSYDPTPSAIRVGRGFLYDAKLSGNGTSSCASCHIDNDTDTIAWDLGNPGGNMATVTDPQSGTQFQMHPMKGPMTTQILRGLANMAPFHWRGDKATLNDFNGAFDSLMGGAQIPAADMQAFSDFMALTPFEPNPNQNLDRTLPPSLFGFNPQIGQTQFTQTPSPIGGPACGSCHSSPLALSPHVAQNPPVGAIVAKVPTFRDFYRRWQIFRTAPGAQNITGYGFEHDGVLDELGIPQLNNMRAFFSCFDTGTAPAVGATRTVTSANATNAALVANVTTLRARAAAGDCDLVGKGQIDGASMGLLYRPATSDFQSDKAGFGPYTWSALQARALAGAVFSLMGAPPGSGVRIGIDRDLDGVLDGDEPSSPAVGTPYCFADGSLATACPCGNTGISGRGCENSVATGGARLAAAGTTNPDAVVLSASSELSSALTIFLQGDADAPLGIVFGDGVRCAAGSLKRLGSKNAVNGSTSYPQAGDLSITAKSAALGDTIVSGTTRYYQAYYRDPSQTWCASPSGNTWNAGNAVAILW